MQAAAQPLNWICHAFTPKLHVTDGRLLSSSHVCRSLSCLAANSGDIHGEFQGKKDQWESYYCNFSNCLHTWTQTRNDVYIQRSSPKINLFDIRNRYGTVLRKRNWNGTVPFPNNSQNCHNEIQERRPCRNISAKPMGKKKEKGHPRIVWRLEETLSKLRLFFFHLYNKVPFIYHRLSYSWYVSKTYQSPVNVHVTATYCVRSTPVYWSRLGRNSYGTDTYLHSSYSRSEYLFRTRALATNLVTTLKIQPIRCPKVLCHFEQAPNG